MASEDRAAPRGTFPLPVARFVRLKRLQACAGLVLATYVLVHLGNAAACALGPEAGGRYLETVRSVTRRPLGWLLWIGAPLAAHAAAAGAVILQERALRRRAEEALRRRRPGAFPAFGRRAFSARMHRWTGLALLALVPLHLVQMRPGLFGLPRGPGGGYDRAAALVRDHPIAATGALAALALCASYHLGYGLWMGLVNLGLLQPGRPRRLGRLAGAAVGGSAAAAAAAGIVALRAFP